MEELIKYMRALVLLQLQAAPATPAGGPAPAGAKAELLLARAGFAHREIAEMLGKTPAAVAKAISRAKATKGVEGDGGAAGVQEVAGE